MTGVLLDIERRVQATALGVLEYFTLTARGVRFVFARPFYWADVVTQMDRIGVGSLPIVILTGLFTGMVLALQSSVELSKFGADVYIGNLVGASMVRELGPVLCSLMVAGRVASGIAAEIGSMRVTEQIDALQSFGTDPIKKLVTPRLIAGITMLPLLTVVADMVGIMGGMLVAVLRIGISANAYLQGVLDTLATSGFVLGIFPKDFVSGLLKPVVFGAIIALTACYYGLNTKGGTEGVGLAATRSVVTCSVLILAADYFITQLLLVILPPRMNTAEAHRLALREELQRDATQPAPAANAPVIFLDDVSLAFDRPILKNVTFDARRGETLMIAGESGSGKSTILKLILRLLLPDVGRINVLGHDVVHLTFEEALDLRRQIGMVFQSAALFDSLTVFENVAYPLRENKNFDESEIERVVRERLEFVDLDPHHVMDQLPSQLSGGMRKRVGIARAIATDPAVILYDEPTSGLDPLTVGTINDLVKKLQRELRVTSIVVTHDIRAGFRVANRVNLLREGEIVFRGTPEDMVSSDDRYIQAFLS